MDFSYCSSNMNTFISKWSWVVYETQSSREGQFILNCPYLPFYTWRTCWKLKFRWSSVRENCIQQLSLLRVHHKYSKQQIKTTSRQLFLKLKPTKTSTISPPGSLPYIRCLLQRVRVRYAGALFLPAGRWRHCQRKIVPCCVHEPQGG